MGFEYQAQLVILLHIIPVKPLPLDVDAINLFEKKNLRPHSKKKNINNFLKRD